MARQAKHSPTVDRLAFLVRNDILLVGVGDLLPCVRFLSLYTPETRRNDAGTKGKARMDDNSMEMR